MKYSLTRSISIKCTNKHIQKGQSLVEMALTLTVLFILLAGAFDIGSIFLDFIALRDAAQEGAVYGSVYWDLYNKHENWVASTQVPTQPPEPDSIVSRVQKSSQNPIKFASFVGSCDPIDPNRICVTYSGSYCTSSTITVTIHYSYTVLMPFIGAIFGQSVPLKSEITNTILLPYCP